MYGSVWADWRAEWLGEGWESEQDRDRQVQCRKGFTTNLEGLRGRGEGIHALSIEWKRASAAIGTIPSPIHTGTGSGGKGKVTETAVTPLSLATPFGPFSCAETQEAQPRMQQ